MCFWFISAQHGLFDKFIAWFMRQFFWLISVQYGFCGKVIKWFMRQMCFLYAKFVTKFIKRKYISGSSAFIMVFVKNL